jgi:hypothetical protein
MNGTYPLTFQATSNGYSYSAAVSLTVAPLAAFHLDAFFSSLVVLQGGSTSGVFDIVSDDGSTNFSVNMSVTGLPPGTTATFAQNPLPGTTSQQSLTLTATSGAALIQDTTAVIVASRPLDGVRATYTTIGVVSYARTTIRRPSSTILRIISSTRHFVTSSAWT